MDVTVITSDPHSISVDEIHDLLEAGKYFVRSVTVKDRHGNETNRGEWS